MRFIQTICIALLLTVAGTHHSRAADTPAQVTRLETTSLDLSGQWNGTWLSHSNAHNGPLTGHFTKIDDNNYRVHFKGRFLGVLPFQYKVVLTVAEQSNDAVSLSGTSNLGLLFGTFSYSATVTKTDFVASYCSKSDYGVFTMSRQCECQ